LIAAIHLIVLCVDGDSHITYGFTFELPHVLWLGTMELWYGIVAEYYVLVPPVLPFLPSWRCRYEQTKPIPSFPRRTWCRRPCKSRQSSPNMASNRLLKVSCGVSLSSKFMTAQILSSLEPFGTDEGRPCARMQMSATRLLISATVSMSEIWTHEGGVAHHICEYYCMAVTMVCNHAIQIKCIISLLYGSTISPNKKIENRYSGYSNTLKVIGNHC
jgi:hypothetical protein